jgi:phage FluMu gp28-like protein
MPYEEFDEWEDDEVYDDEDAEDEEGNGSITINLPTPHSGQLDVLQSLAKWRVLCCGRRWGKSTICLILALHKMLDGKSVAYVTPTYSLSKEFFNDISKLIPEKAISYHSKTDLSIQLITGGELKFFSGEATRDIRGRKFHRVIIDEAAFIPDLEEIWMQVIMPTLATTNGDALFVSTPNGMNFFYSIFMKGKYNEENYESFHFPSHTSPFVSKDFLEIARTSVTEDTFKQEYLAEPLSSVGNPFGIEHIKYNTITELSNKETIVYAADIAKHNDWTVIVGLDEDGCMTYFDRFRGEWSLTEDKIKALPDAVLKVIDATGVGDFVFERLQQQVNNISGFKFTSKSKPALMKELIIDVQQGRLKFNKVTADEMMVFEYSQSASGHPLYQAQSGFHDDAVMAIAMANHFKKQAWANINWALYTI